MPVGLGGRFWPALVVASPPRVVGAGAKPSAHGWPSASNTVYFAFVAAHTKSVSGAREDLERDFAAAMRDIYLRAKQEAGYNATYFLQMLAELGPLETARRLVISTQPSQGFTALWERHRLDLTVEARVVERRFAPLFTELERDAAMRRLIAYEYIPQQD